jgi:hypothetical protein
MLTRFNVEVLAIAATNDPDRGSREDRECVKGSKRIVNPNDRWLTRRLRGVLEWEVVIPTYLQLRLGSAIDGNTCRAMGKTAFWTEADNGVEVVGGRKERRDER